jgi:hypothetical protein
LATIDSIRSELENIGRKALAGFDPQLLEKVKRSMIACNGIQVQIDTLKIEVDGLQKSVPEIPTGIITPS